MKRGFSLLEVMVAVGILGLVLSVILGAQGGLAASHRSATNLGLASTQARCKMTEVEERLLKLGYPELDQTDTEVPCCEDESTARFTCDVKVQKVELPNLPTSSGGDAGSLGIGPEIAATAGPGGLPLNNPAGGATLDLDAGLSGLGSQIQSQVGGAGAQGLVSMALGFVYPVTKPMMEASIRRVTVTVRWKEGPVARELGLVQFVTNPQRGGFLGGVGVDGGALAPGASVPGGAASGAAAGAAPIPTGGAFR